MKQTIAISAGVLALALAAADPAVAQLIYPAPPPGAAMMPPYEVVAIVRSTGLEPLSRPVRHGPAYVLSAADPAGQVMRVVVDARLGRIVRVVPVFGPRYAAPVGPPPYGRPPGAIAQMPDGYSPNSRIAALPPPGLDGPPIHGPAGAGLPSARAPAAQAPPQPSAQAGPPPLPRPRPNVASAGTSAAKPVADAVPAAAPPAPKEAKDTTAAAPSAVAPPAVEMQE